MSVARPVAMALLLAVAPAAQAAEPPAPLHYDLALDASLTAGMALTALLLSVYQSRLAPAKCRWCSPGWLDDKVHGALVWSDAHSADVLSSVVALGVLPVSALGYLALAANDRGHLSDAAADALLVAEAMSAALILNQTVKLLVGRERPYAYYGRAVSAAAADTNASFYGGHSSFAFSLVAATVTVASMRGYAGTGAAAGVGFALAAGLSYLRLAADQHYLSDVAVGAAMGLLVGWAIPYLFHRPTDPDGRQRVALRLAPGGIAVDF
jgi:membrane-associated phospholipid phosphatase